MIRAILIFILFSETVPVRLIENYTGYAYDLKTEELLYSEEHSDNYIGGKIHSGKVIYRDPSGRTIAVKNLDFSSFQWAPEFHLEDKRFALIEGSKWETGNLTLFSGPIEGASPKVIPIPKKTPLVLDAGFDVFVREHWQALMLEKEITFLFGSPSEKKLFEFQLTTTKLTKTDKEILMTLQMKPASNLLRWLVPPIQLQYRQISKSKKITLVEYIGLTNMAESPSRKFRAKIKFPK